MQLRRVRFFTSPDKSSAISTALPKAAADCRMLAMCIAASNNPTLSMWEITAFSNRFRYAECGLPRRRGCLSEPAFPFE